MQVFRLVGVPAAEAVFAKPIYGLIDDDHLHVVAGSELLQHLRLPESAGAVVLEVEAGLEAPVAVRERRGPRPRAGQVQAIDAAADEGLGGLAPVAPVVLLGAAGRVVEVGARA